MWTIEAMGGRGLAKETVAALRRGGVPLAHRSVCFLESLARIGGAQDGGGLTTLPLNHLRRAA